MRVPILAVAAALALAAIAGPAPSPARAADPPRTGFEESDGAEWTSYDDELAFLAAVDAASDQVEVDVIGRTEEGRLLHLVRLGTPAPRTAGQARREPVQLHVCTQHGNEPAGREACLIRLRDWAFSTDPAVIAQLSMQTILFVPTANPDGREGNQRTNTEGVDINRDHLNLSSPEAQAIARVISDWQPDIAIDHHEYGPGTPVLYDDEVLYLWPRNLNVDEHVHDLGVAFSKEVLAGCLSTAGFTSDEYGIDAVGDTDVQQTAGGGDEGIMRNAAGLRHTVGILIESAVTMNVTNGPDELTEAGQRRRRVASQVATIDCTFDFMRDNATELSLVTAEAAERATVAGRNRLGKIYFAGQDDDTTLAQNGDEEVSADPPCGYQLTAAQAREVAVVLELQGIAAASRSGGRYVTMGQPAKPVIPLLLDGRNTDRAAIEAAPVETCPAPGRTTTPPREPGDDDDPEPAQPRPVTGLPATGGLSPYAGLAALAAALAATALRRAAR